MLASPLVRKVVAIILLGLTALPGNAGAQVAAPALVDEDLPPEEP